MKEHLKEYVERSSSPAVRGLRILLEYFYATEIFERIHRNKSKVISVFGSARTMPESPEYRLAYKVGSLLYGSGFAVVTGASRGIMQAANQGVADAIARDAVRLKKAATPEMARKTAFYKTLLRQHSVGLSISLPMESDNNPFVGVSATFHYFMVRKFFFGTLSSGFIACEGGWGTRDELFEILTLVQTGKAPVMPIVYLSPDPKHLQADLQHTLRKKYIAPDDLHLIHLVRTPEEASRIIKQFYRVVDKIEYDREQSIRVFLKKTIPLHCRKAVEHLLQKNHEGPLVAEWKARELSLFRYAPHSYGSFRKAMDLLNQA